MSKQVRAGERIDALTRHNRPIRSEVDILSRAFAPRQNPHPAPPLTISEAPAVCLIVNMSWVSHVIGVLETLNQPDAWEGDADEKRRAQNEIQLLIEMLMTGDACMVDPCCPETNELLIDIKVLNQTLIENQLTIINNQEITIDNDTTIINQNTQVEANQYLTQYQNFISNNQTVNQFNQMLYDGTPQSIAPELGEDFGGTEATDAALCAAIKSYIDTLVYVFGMQAAALSGLATVITGIGFALAPVTVGTSLIGVAVVGAIAASAAMWQGIVGDPEAQRKVACCMFDALKDSAISQAAFQTSCTACDLGGVYESHEGFLAAQISACNGLEENWLAFVAALGQSQGAGNASECSCECEGDVVIQDYYGSGCVITPMGECIYRFTQATPDGTGKYFYSFQDILSRCLLVENSPDPAYPTQGVGTNTFVTDCDGVEGAEFPGGMTGGTLQATRWWQGGDTGGFQYFKITLAE